MLKVAVLREEKQNEYPKLKISTNLSQVVLFTSPRTGTVIDPGTSTSKRGEHYYSLAEEMFENFYGSVTLSETKD